MNEFDNYFEKKRKDQQKLDIQMNAISKEILLLAYDLDLLIPYGMFLSYSGGDANNLSINIYDRENKSDELVWQTDFYTNGQLADLKKGKAVKQALQEAIKFKRLPGLITYKESYREPYIA